MSKSIENELGTYNGHSYFLCGKADPGFNDPSYFAAIIYFRDSSATENVEIARIDNAHGRAHLHKLDRSTEEQEYKDVDQWDAMKFLEDNWRTYAEMYQKAHGRP